MKKELLSPAGDFESLKQAIHNGCDAVYLGGKKFGARKFASNFDDEEMVKAIKYCHLYGVKIYVTVNTIVFDNEVEAFLEYIMFLHKNGVDAVIMQDLGMISLVRKVLPNLEIHASTQAHTHNQKQVKFLEELGVRRIVTAREMSLEEIKKLDTNLEIETFIHGALCVCYSGQCLFSSLLLNRSGNRGECAGVCRLPFTLLENGKEIKTAGKYLLSPKELNTTNRIKELLESNITSFKIEGRMKSPTTIGFITRLYRMLIDHYEKNEELLLTEEETKKLMVLFNRGFTEGFLFNETGEDLMNILSPNHIGIEMGKVLEVTKSKIKIKLADTLNQGDGIRFKEESLGMIANFIYDNKDRLISNANKGDIVYLDNKIGLAKCCTILKTIDYKLLKELENYAEKKIPISIKVKANLNSNFKLIIKDDKNEVIVEDDIIEEATGSGTTSSRILEQLNKLKDTPFCLVDYDLDVDDKIFVSISKLNELRRKAINKLIDIRENIKEEVIINEKYSLKKITEEINPLISALVRNKEQLKVCLEEKIDIIYVTDYKLYKEYSNLNNVYLRTSRVMNKYNDYNNEKLLVGETGSIYKYKNSNELVSDYYFNVTNSYNVDYFRQLNIKGITLSVEGNIDNIKNIISKVGNGNLEVIVYGKLEAMIMKYCPLKLLVNDDKTPCNVCRNKKRYELKDRNGERYPMLPENELTHIFYYRNLNLIDKIEDLLVLGINRYRIEFFDEDSKEVKNIIKKIKHFFNK